MQQGNVGNVKKKDAEGELGMICAPMPVVHFLRAQNAKNLHILIIHHQKYDGKVVQQSTHLVVIFEKFYK